MGGGPRTFPGGINKWQWKRLHEKRAKEKERRLLEQEKQLYQARIRYQIRAKLAGQPGSSISSPSSSSDYNPMTAKDHIKALADRFMKEGAEDLWNEADGPVKSSAQPELPIKNRDFASPDDLKKLITDGRSLVNRQETWHSTGVYNSSRPRHYSVGTGIRTPSKFRFQRNDSSSSDDELEGDSVRPVVSNSRWHRSSLSREESSYEDLNLKGGSNVKKMMSTASLGKYDVKKKRLSPKLIHEEDLSEQVKAIRYELNRRNLPEDVGEKDGEESILSEKRFDQCSISQLTVKALTSAGYLRLTRVQEATLSVALQGTDALVRAKTGTGKSAAFLCC